jgi:hypothetical protein
LFLSISLVNYFSFVFSFHGILSVSTFATLLKMSPSHSMLWQKMSLKNILPKAKTKSVATGYLTTGQRLIISVIVALHCGHWGEQSWLLIEIFYF